MSEVELIFNVNPVIELQFNAVYDTVTQTFVFDPNDFNSADFQT